MIYLDYMASTPIAPEVTEAMVAVMSDPMLAGNPSASIHQSSCLARACIEEARAQVADLIHTTPESLFWTSGATEANNLAIQGLARGRQARGKHIITSAIEHPSVRHCVEQMAEEGFEITLLTPDESGIITLDQLAQAIREDTILVSLMHVNNEIGVIQPIEQFAHFLAERDILFHVDAVQSAGKLDINLEETPISAMTFSAHKLYGPKGIGALYLRQRPKVRCRPMWHGGHQERKLRPGTLATHQIVGMGKAFALAKQGLTADHKHAQSLQQHMLQQLSDCGEYAINGCTHARIPHNLNVAFKGVDAKQLLTDLHDTVAFSLGAACNASTLAPSQVLSVLGHDLDRVKSSVRLSWGRYTQAEDLNLAIAELAKAIAKQK